MTGIEKSAFADCRALTNIAFGTRVTCIGDFAFNSCLHLKNLEITNGLDTIGSAAFFGCTGLARVTLGKELTSLGNTAFGSCRALTNITFLGNRPPERTNLFLRSTPIVYFLPGTTGWGETYSGRPTQLLISVASP